MNRFAQKVKSNDNRLHNISSNSIKKAFHSCITALEDGWFSFSLSKMIVALACASRNEEIAIEFIR